MLEDVSITIHAGERCGIIGPNGAGKSTLFNIIAGELPLTRGSVRFLGGDVTRLSAHARARRGLARTFQTTTLFPRLTVMENLVLALQASSAERFALLAPRSRYRARDDEARALLERVGLGARADAPVDALGYGEKRQIEILLALAQKPKLLLLDEPTAGLAPGDASLVTEMLKREHAGPDDGADRARHGRRLRRRRAADGAALRARRGGRPGRRDPRRRQRAGDLSGRQAVSLLDVDDIHTYYEHSHILQGVSLQRAERPASPRCSGATASARRR